VIKFLDTKQFVPDRIVAELASVYGEQAYAKKAVKYWIHQVELGKSDMDSLDCSSAELAPATVRRHLTTSLDMQPRHFQ
jgi:hypothetical protein